MDLDAGRDIVGDGRGLDAGRDSGSCDGKVVGRFGLSGRSPGLSGRSSGLSTTTKSSSYQ
jgi:hypothetical protein